MSELELAIFGWAFLFIMKGILVALGVYLVVWLIARAVDARAVLARRRRRWQDRLR